jgi:DNA-binding transcriptional regulator YiaG
MVDQVSRYANALRTAASTLGGAGQLAAYLGVSPQTVQAWLDGREAPPLQAFLGALDVIADGPFAPQHRPVRVAIMPDEVGH